VKDIRVILSSGLSGSGGKQRLSKALEDIGFYCVDNLPILLCPNFIELCEQSGGKDFQSSRGGDFEDCRHILPGRRWALNKEGTIF